MKTRRYAEHRFPHLVCAQPYRLVGCLDARRFEPPYGTRSGARPHDCVAGEEELSQDGSPMSAFSEAELADVRESRGMNDPANLGLIPWAGLPRRAWHRNENAGRL